MNGALVLGVRPQTLTEADRERLGAHISEIFWIQYQSWSRVHEGIFERTLWDRSNRQDVRSLANAPGGKQVWRMNRDMFDPQFVQEIEGSAE